MMKSNESAKMQKKSLQLLEQVQETEIEEQARLQNFLEQLKI